MDGLYFKEEGGEMVLKGLKSQKDSQAWWVWGVHRKVIFTYSLALVRTFREEAKGQEFFFFLMTDREF